MPGVQVLSACSSATAIVSFVADGAHPHDIRHAVRCARIAVAHRAALHFPLLEHLGCGPTTRASFALYTARRVERLIDGVA